jgi:hypothetical protein
MGKTFLKFLAAFLIASNFLSLPAYCQYGAGSPVYQSWTSFGNITTKPTVSSVSAAIQLPPAASGTTGSAGLTAKICNLGTVGADIWLSFGTANTVTAAVGSGAWLPFGACGAFNLQPFVATHYTWMAAICDGPACSTQIYVETGIGTPNLR